MTAEVLFFGATADIVGLRRIAIAFEPNTKASDILRKILVEYPTLASHKLHFSVNQRFSTGDEIICDKDELAIFTAVSGG